MKNYLLTDFTTEGWKGIDIDSVNLQIERINRNLSDSVSGYLFGEMGNPKRTEIFMSQASHAIKNITFVDGKVYGDVKFLNNYYGKKAETIINKGFCKFKIRSLGMVDNDAIDIHSIITWDIDMIDNTIDDSSTSVWDMILK